MVKQTVSLKVLPEDATNKELTCTLSDKSLATINPVTGGVELETKKSGTGELTVESHHGEVTKTVPVNVGETNDILIDGTNGTGSRYVKDLSAADNYVVTNTEGKPSMDNYVGHSRTSSTVSNGVLTVKKISAQNESDAFYQIGYTNTTNKLPIKNGQRWVFGGKVKGKGILQVFYRLKGETNYSSNKTLFDNTIFEDKFTEITVPDNVDALAARFRFQDGALTNSTFDVKDVFFKIDDETYSPAPEDVGVVHGQPNLLSGTSSTLSEVTFIQTQYKETNLVVSNLFKPNDLVTYAVKIDNTAGTADVFAQFTFKKSDNTYVSFNGSSVLKGSIGRSMVQVTILGEYTNIYVKPLVKSNSTISTTVRYGEEKLIKGSLEAMDEWTPTQAEFEGKPNLLDGTSDQWVEETFSSYDSSIFPVVPLSTSGLKIGDTLSLSVEIDNTKSISKSRSFISYYNSSGSRLVTNSTGLIDEGTVGVATVTSVIPEGAVSVIVSRVSKHTTVTATVSTRKHKLIKGTVAELGIWVPKDRTEYDKNLGIVPFTTADYNTLQTADGIVRAETKVVGRGAEIEFKFDVIGTLEKKYPYLFEGLKTMAEKKSKYLSMVKSVGLSQFSRGGGIRTNGSDGKNHVRPYIKNLTNGFLTLSSWANTTNNFVHFNDTWNESRMSLIQNNGSYIVFVCSKKNDSSDGGAISDGITPAWVEVKDIELRVTIQLPEDPNAQPITITIPPS